MGQIGEKVSQGRERRQAEEEQSRGRKEQEKTAFSGGFVFILHKIKPKGTLADKFTGCVKIVHDE